MVSGRRGKAPVGVCLAGLSPAVVTETLYALATRRRGQVIPREVHLITTHGGYPTVVGNLLGPAGAIARLRQQYCLPASSFLCTDAHVHVLRDGRGRPLEDIRTAEDSRAAGDFIGALVRELASDPARELHCSLAGGRKTMSALLATALQLHGRPSDRLYHVLVSEPFDRIPEFFYPPRPPQLYRLGNRSIDSGQARIELAEIPFVRLGPVVKRFGLSSLALEALAQEIQAEAEGLLKPEVLRLDPQTREVTAGRRRLRLPPQELALYAFYAGERRACRNLACRAGGRCPRCHPTDDEVHDRRGRLLELYRAARPAAGGSLVALLEAEHRTADEMDSFRSWLQQTRSRVNRAIQAALGRGPHGERYAITTMDADRPEGRRRRGLLLPPEFIDVGRAQVGRGSPHKLGGSR
jgi:CRISPR-associated protein (TIGR02584 family)